MPNHQEDWNLAHSKFPEVMNVSLGYSLDSGIHYREAFHQIRRLFVLGTVLWAFITVTIAPFLPFLKQTADQESQKKKKKMLTSHPSPTTSAAPQLRIDAGALTTLTGCAWELHTVMAHHCLASA